MDLGLKGKRAVVTGGEQGHRAGHRRRLRRRRCRRLDLRAQRRRGGRDGRRAEGQGRQRLRRVRSTWPTARRWRRGSRRAPQELGGIDALVCNVSALAVGDSAETWEKSFRVDMMHSVNAVAAAVPFLEKSSSASIVLISSVSGFEVDFAAGSYGAIKAALIHYAKGLSRQLVGKGIRVNCVSPGNTYFEGGIWQTIEKNMPELYSSTLKVNPTGRFGTAGGGGQRRGVHLEPGGEPHLGHQPGDRRRPHRGGLGESDLSTHDHHTIHRAHIHHGWNNAFAPRLTIAPGETVQFETVDASSGQLSRDSTAADLAKLDLARVNPVTGPVYIDGAKPGDALKVTVLSLRPSGWGWTGQHPRLRPADRPVPRGPAAPLALRLRPGAGDVRPGRARAAEADVRHDRRRAGRAGPAQHHPAAQRRRQHGRARHRRRYRALPAGRGGRRALLGRRHARGAGRRRGLRHRHRERDRRRPEVRAGQGRPAAHAALRHARPGEPAISTARATR